MATPLIPLTLAWLMSIWLASRMALPTIALVIAGILSAVGVILTQSFRQSPGQSYR
jgi:hypothetical protein